MKLNFLWKPGSRKIKVKDDWQSETADRLTKRRVERRGETVERNECENTYDYYTEVTLIITDTMWIKMNEII